MLMASDIWRLCITSALLLHSDFTVLHSSLSPFSHAALVSAWDAHIFAILGDGAARDLDALRLQDARELLVG
jgi:hypothetical protein